MKKYYVNDFTNDERNLFWYVNVFCNSVREKGTWRFRTKKIPHVSLLS